MSLPNVHHALEALATALRAATKKPWELLEAPDAPIDTPEMPYGVIELIPGGGTGGDVAQPDGMRTIVVQLTAVAPDSTGALALGAAANRAVLERGPDGFATAITPTAPTYVMNRSFDSAGGLDRDGTLVNHIERFALDLHSH